MDSDSSDGFYAPKKKRKNVTHKCPYIEAVNRFNLDFDFEKVCSVTLSNSNIYACLVCGKYFQGRGKLSPAYVHSMDAGHHIFINLTDERVWCVPDDYEVTDPSLEDVKFNLNPRYAEMDVVNIPISALSLTGSEFFPGLVSLNQIKEDSYLNASIHALCGVVKLRDFFLTHCGEERLSRAFSVLQRKMCNAQSFKGIVSPHDFLQAVSISSKNEFSSCWADPLKFLNWFLPALKSETVSGIFQGSTLNGSFISVSIDLPVIPVFKSEAELIPTVSIEELLTRRFSSDLIRKFPETLIICFNRFVRNNFFMEKNATIVRFPLKNLDLSPYGLNIDNREEYLYDLVSTICHEGKPEEGHFRSLVLHPGMSDQWFECDGLRIRKQLPQSVSLAESYLQVWSRREIIN